MKIIIMGTGDFIVPSFKRLLESEHKIAALVTMPIRGRRKGDDPIPAVRQLAEAHQVPIFDPDDINQPEGIALLKGFDADLIFICDYGKILSSEAIRAARLGGVNLHGSLLPKYRGAAPIPRAILAGDTMLGVSVIHITPEVDAGPILLSSSFQFGMTQTAPEIEAMLARFGAPMVIEGIRDIETGTALTTPQNPNEATRAPKIRKEEGRIDWNRSPREIVNQYRALQPWPKIFCDWQRLDRPTDAPIRLILGALGVEPLDELPKVLPGTVLTADKNRVVISAGSGAIQVGTFQPAGKRAMSAEEFLRGYRMKTGDMLS